MGIIKKIELKILGLATKLKDYEKINSAYRTFDYLLSNFLQQ